MDVRDSIALQIKNREDRIAKVRGSQAEAQSKMNAYEAELGEAVAKLKKKHGFEGLDRSLRVVAETLATLEDEQRRDRAFLAIQIMRQLFSADETASEDTKEYLKTTWSVEISQNDNVSEDRFAACFEAFAREVCTAEWWRHAEVKDGDGHLYIEGAMPYRWSPCIGVRIPVGLLELLAEFQTACEPKVNELSRSWAVRWVTAHVEDDEKLAALQTAILKAKGGTSDAGGAGDSGKP